MTKKELNIIAKQMREYHGIRAAIVSEYSVKLYALRWTSSSLEHAQRHSIEPLREAIRPSYYTGCIEVHLIPKSCAKAYQEALNETPNYNSTTPQTSWQTKLN